MVPPAFGVVLRTYPVSTCETRTWSVWISSGVDLTGADLRGVDLTGAVVTIDTIWTDVRFNANTTCMDGERSIEGKDQSGSTAYTCFAPGMALSGTAGGELDWRRLLGQ